MKNLSPLRNMANVLRRDVLKMTTIAGSGHPTSCLSCAEIISTLFFDEMKYDINNPNNKNNDEFVLSKGHAAPILYAALFRADCTKEPLDGLRTINSPYEGHPLPGRLQWIKVATGSLGQGISMAVGMALAAKIKNSDYRTYVLCGDGELAEGSVYEAAEIAAKYKLDNLCLIVDINRLGQSGETLHGYNIRAYKKKFKSFGFKVLKVDGHNILQILIAFEIAKTVKNRPTVMLAKTKKGKGVSFLENKEGWHGKVLTLDLLDKALEEIKDPGVPRITIKTRENLRFSGPPLAEPKYTKNGIKRVKIKIQPNYKIGQDISTREAYGNALLKIAAKDKNLIVLDGDVRTSTYSGKVADKYPKQFIESYIAEQNMAAMSVGLAAKGFNVFASTFSAFLTRAHDQLRLAALSGKNITFVGSHSGVSVGQDGPSQMGLEDISMFRSLPGSIVLYPSDAVSAEKLVELANNSKGIKYIRTTRPRTDVIYKNNENFRIGDFKIVKASKKDKAIIIGAGITLHEAIKAYEILRENNKNVAVVDLYCVKPFNNANKLIKLAKKKGNKIIIAEDHYKEGGIGEMLKNELYGSGIKIISLAVNKIPHSAKTEELLEIEEINAGAIVKSSKIFPQFITDGKFLGPRENR